ncbi:phosphate:Na+ symporter [Hoeflea marina]|uniref:Phosphate:Na+ symporter n=1 Tax=Hoeflea marina TaxID=274592 RepID=A0A317PE14_9HYPH|nr:Na/Pi cotransporter family protein [Hoeflea marina]PWV95383.1 phosphate:Na+ symporter [Hoeflea marina]
MSFLAELIGAIALLLWGLRMVRTGVMRAFGVQVQKWAGRAEGRILPAFGAGIGVAVLLQSSAATAMIVATFAGRGVLGATTALVTILGADIGTALAVLVASQKITFLSPLLMAVGVFGFMSTEDTKKRSLMRAVTGLGLILLALSLIARTAAVLGHEQGFVTVLEILAGQPFLLVLLALVMSYLAHSSLAIVLLTIGFVGSGLLGLESGLYMVLGANIGSGLLPAVANWGARLEARVPVTANLMVRVLGVAIAFPLVGIIVEAAGSYAGMAVFPALFHLGLNLAVSLAGLIAAPALVRLARLTLPANAADEGLFEPKYLDQDLIDNPVKALALAKREALNMADITQGMMRAVLPVLRNNDDMLRRTTIANDDKVDRLFDAIKLYIARVMQQQLSAEETQRALDILAFTANMEHIGDIIDGGLMDLAGKKLAARISFSDQGFAEICSLHEAVSANFELAVNTFVTDDVDLARMLYSAKAEVRDLERRSVETHLGRLGEGNPETIGTSSVHLDILRDLKRINSHLTSIAYPVLKASGEVPKTKWKRQRRTA